MEVKLSASSPIWSRVRLPARHWLVQKRYSACVPADWRHAQTNMKKKKKGCRQLFFFIQFFITILSYNWAGFLIIFIALSCSAPTNYCKYVFIHIYLLTFTD